MLFAAVRWSQLAQSEADRMLKPFARIAGAVTVTLALVTLMQVAQAQEIRKVEVERLTVLSSKPFDAVVAAVDGAVGHPNMAEFQKASAASQNFAELEGVV